RWRACSSHSATPPCSTPSKPPSARGTDDRRGTRKREVIAMPEAPSIVFVVDDDVSVRESLELLIRSAGWQPETFPSAQEFLSRPRSAAPSCLVLDVTLPGLN